MMVSLCAPGLAWMLWCVLAICVMTEGKEPSASSDRGAAESQRGGISDPKIRSQCCNSMSFPYSRMCHKIQSFAEAHCCDAKSYNKDHQLCCGNRGSKVIWLKESAHHLCCNSSRYDSRTHHCCDTLQIVRRSETCQKPVSDSCDSYDPINQLCCNNSVVGKPTALSECCGNETFDEATHLCCRRTWMMNETQTCHDLCRGTERYNPMENSCNHSLHIVPRRETFDEATQSCCTITWRKEEKQTCHDRCCGTERYNPMENSCNHSLHIVPGREGGLTTTSPPALPACDLGPEPEPQHVSSSQHVCGKEGFDPDSEICCNGERQTKGEGRHCCGNKIYHTGAQDLKCCSGTLFNVTSTPNSTCCGAFLQKQSAVCCVSEDMAMPYAAKNGFYCCGHEYYNSSLWSCPAGILRPGNGNNRTEGLRLLSNMTNKDLCHKVNVGIFESKNVSTIAFSHVLEVNGNGTITPAVSPHVMTLPQPILKLTPGKTYFFSETHVYTDFNHHSVLQSLHFIFSKCPSN